jgi:preprotein translocase subunit YajC
MEKTKMFINTALADTETITVQDVDTTPSAPPAIESAWTSMIPMILIFFVFYFFLIRPQEKKRREQEDMVSSVKRGEEVITNSGIYGTIKKLNDSDNTVMLEIANGIEIKILKSCIVDIVSRKTATPAPQTNTGDKKKNVKN